MGYGYDNDGNMVQKIDPRGLTVTYGYDALKATAINDGLKKGTITTEQARKMVDDDPNLAIAESAKDDLTASSTQQGPPQQGTESSTATPINFTAGTAVIAGDPEKPNPSNNITGSYLLVVVKWESSTGKLSDLAGLQMREKLEYSQQDTKDGVFKAPAPFAFSNKNPYFSKSFSMEEGKGGDRHSGYSVNSPYKAATVTIKQTYQWSRDGKNWTDVGSGITITRTISYDKASGGWQQSISTSLSSKTAVINLPPGGFFQMR